MLFGHQNNDVKQPEPDMAPVPSSAPVINPLAVDPTTGVSLPVAPADPDAGQNGSFLTPPAPPNLPAPPMPTPVITPDAQIDAPADQPAGAPTVVEPTAEPVSLDAPDVPPPAPAPAPEIAPPAEAAPEVPASPEPAPATQPEEPAVMQLDDVPAPAPEVPKAAEQPPVEDPVSAPAAPLAPEDLLALKQQALEQLTPLVDELDQTPEERFRTKMMMIQSTDNQSLIKDAYEAAQAIQDEKVRAQALLDIINEINYFTSSQH